MKRGDTNRLKYGRHIINTSSWELENFGNKHGVGIMLKKRWRQRIIDTDYINRQHIKLMSVYFHHSKYADHHIEIMYKTIEKHMVHNNKYIPTIGGDFNAELGPGKGTERKSVGRYTLNESNKRGDWLQSCYTITPLSTRCSGRLRRNRRPSSLQKRKKNKLTTF